MTLSLATLTQSPVCQARVTADSGYSKAQSYSAALRFLRVDKNFEVIERDPEAAYLIFRYPTPQRKEGTSTGTIEVVELKDRVTLIVNLSQMPRYHEQLLSQELQKKLRSEYGSPPERKRPAKKKPADDDDTTPTTPQDPKQDPDKDQHK
jgi:hypothetical protein